MIAHFALMGDLYQYDPYDTQASLWNSYPWHLGADNGLNFNASIPDFAMAKMVWGIDDTDSAIGAAITVLGDFGMYSTLIVFDNIGNIGDGIGSVPDPIPSDYYKDSLVSVTSGTVFGAKSRLVIIHANTNTERSDDPVPLVSVMSGTVFGAKSNPIP